MTCLPLLDSAGLDWRAEHPAVADSSVPEESRLPEELEHPEVEETVHPEEEDNDVPEEEESRSSLITVRSNGDHL